MPAMSKNKCTTHSDTTFHKGGGGASSGAHRGACKRPIREPGCVCL